MKGWKAIQDAALDTGTKLLPKERTQNIKPEILETMEERRKNKGKDGDEYEEIK